MFYIRYLFAELRRRKGRTLLTAAGLAVGVSLVVAVSALTAGLDDAQQQVLAPLRGVGTDMSIIRPITFEGGQAGTAQGPGGLSDEERKQLEDENGGGFGVDFGDLETGSEFTRTSFMSTELSFDESEADSISKLKDVAGVGKSLKLTLTTVSGTVPDTSSGGGGFGGPPPGGDRGGFDIQQKSITGIDTTEADLAPATPGDVVDGDYLDEGSTTTVMISQTHANNNEVKVGDSVDLDGTKYQVVGIVAAPVGGSTTDFYIDLGTLQKLSDREGRINTLTARADSVDNVAAVAKSIENSFDGAEVTTAADLADRVSGSLTDARNLASKLGTALAAVALAAAVGLASLLTLSSVNKRVRELGTLKALGWRPRQVVRQIGAETVAQGVLGGLMGAALGFGIAKVIELVGIDLEATVAAAQTGPFGGRGPGGRGQEASEAASQTISIGAPVDVQILLLAIGLAILGGLIAAVIASFRVSRLRPAEALRSVE